MLCPECGSHEITVAEYDYGTDRETGYHDCGEKAICRECGEEMGLDELLEEENA